MPGQVPMQGPGQSMYEFPSSYPNMYVYSKLQGILA